MDGAGSVYWIVRVTLPNRCWVKLVCIMTVSYFIGYISASKAYVLRYSFNLGCSPFSKIVHHLHA